MRTLVVLPTYEEAENIAEVLRRLRAAVPAADVLVVDDSSPDGTAEVAKAAGVEVGGVDVMIRAGKAGLGSAYRAGFAEGLRRGYDILVEMDSDLSHDPAALPTLLRAVEGGADLAIGSRYIPGGSIPHWSFRRRALSRWGNRYAGIVLGLPVADATSGYRAYLADDRRRHRPAHGAGRRLRLPDRDGLPGGPPRRAHRRGAHRVRRPGAGRRRRCRPASSSRP